MPERPLSIRPNRWTFLKRCFRLKVLVSIGGVAIAATVIYFPNYARLKELRGENKRLILENENLTEEIGEYEEKLKRIGKDPYLYEKIAREELGIAKEGEIVIDIKE